MGNSMSEREKKEAEFGERIYEIVQEFYPESSDNITGMILEAEYDELERLLTTTGRKELEARIHTAAKNLLTSDFCERENCDQPENKDNGSHDNEKKPYSLHGQPLYLQKLHDSDKSNLPDSKRMGQCGISTGQCSAFKNKQALGETIYSLIEKQHPGDAEKLTGILLEMDIKSLEHLIKDTDLLESKVQEVLAVFKNPSGPMQNGQSELLLKQQRDKSVIGEELFDLVSALTTEQADKITGMLLEMDEQDLEDIVKNQVALEEKVNQALTALNNQLKNPESTSSAEREPDKTFLGEKLYYVTSDWYPDQADKITGMLLELDVTTLNLLLEDPVALKDKASLAANALCETNSEEKIPCVSDKGKESRHCLAKQFYDIINEWYPDKGKKLTEMLLDSDKDCSTLETLVLNKKLLKEEIERMLNEEHNTAEAAVPNRELTKNEDSTREELGGKLYEIVEESHPENADKITGMLLEMSVTDIENLLRDPQVLEEKIQLAEKALV